MGKLLAATPILLLAILHLSLTPSAADLQLRVHDCNNTDGNYTATSPYKSNLNTLFTKLTSTNTTSGFYNLTAGSSPNTANLISLCLGNVGLTSCHACQSFLTGSLPGLCPTQKTAIAWSDDCFVRYSSDPIFGALAENPGFIMLHGEVASGDKYKRVVRTVLEGLPGNASVGGGGKKFAAAEVEFNSSVRVFGAAQCTPDLSREECRECLEVGSEVMQSCTGCAGQRGARILLPSCFVRYEEYKFYLTGSESPAPAPAPGPSDPAPTSSVVPSVAPTSSVTPSATPTNTVSPTKIADAPTGHNDAPEKIISSISSIVVIVLVGAFLSALM